MAIGINWKEIWGPVWGPVWDTTGASGETPIGLNWGPIWKQVWGPVWTLDGTTIPDAPADVAVESTGGTTAHISITDTSGGTAAHLWQIRPEGGTWVDATGGTNMSFPGTVDFYVTGLTPASRYEVRVLAWVGGVESDWAYAADLFWTDNTGGGESGLPGSDVTNPTLTGVITVTNNTTGTSYTLTVDAGSDDSGSVLYEYSIDGGSYIDMGTSPTVNVSGRTSGALDAILLRCYDAAGNRSSPPLSTNVRLPFVGALTAAAVWAYEMSNGQTAEQNVLAILTALAGISGTAIAEAVRLELAVELARINVAISTRSSPSDTVPADVRSFNGNPFQGSGSPGDSYRPL